MGDMADQNIQDGFDNLYSDDTCKHGYDLDGPCPDCDGEDAKESGITWSNENYGKDERDVD